MLDCFCHNGSFALNAARYGAADVLGVDISEEALEVARENAARNGLNVRFEAHNCFDLLRELTDAGEKYDLVILDPPAFTKSRQAVQSALRGYKEINLRGLKLTKPGGFLVTCSCSQHVSTEMFQDMVNQAARDAKRHVRMVEYRTQAYDHPILPRRSGNEVPEVHDPSGHVGRAGSAGGQCRWCHGDARPPHEQGAGALRFVSDGVAAGADDGRLGSRSLPPAKACVG